MRLPERNFVVKRTAVMASAEMRTETWKRSRASFGGCAHRLIRVSVLLYEMVRRLVADEDPIKSGVSWAVERLANG